VEKTQLGISQIQNNKSK